MKPYFLNFENNKLFATKPRNARNHKKRGTLGHGILCLSRNRALKDHADLEHDIVNSPLSKYDVYMLRKYTKYKFLAMAGFTYYKE